MVRTVLTCIALAGCAGLAQGTEYQSPSVGDRVYAKSLAVRPSVGRRIIDDLTDGPAWRVTAVQDGWLWVGRGWVRSTDVVKCDEAVEWFTTEIARRPSAYAYHTRARAHRRNDDDRRALDDCNAALRLAPRWPRAYASRAGRPRPSNWLSTKPSVPRAKSASSISRPAAPRPAPIEAATIR